MTKWLAFLLVIAGLVVACGGVEPPKEEAGSTIRNEPSAVSNESPMASQNATPEVSPTPAPDVLEVDLINVRSRLYDAPLMPALQSRPESTEAFRDTAETYSEYFDDLVELLEEQITLFPEHESALGPVVKQLKRSASKSVRVSERSSEGSLTRGVWELFMVDWQCSVMALATAIEDVDGTPFETTIGLLPAQVQLITTRENFIALNNLGICTKFEKGFPRIVATKGIGEVTPDWLSQYEVQWIQQNVSSGWAIALSPLLFVPYAYSNDSLRFWAEVLSGPRFGKCREYIAFSARVPHAPSGDDGSCI